MNTNKIAAAFPETERTDAKPNPADRELPLYGQIVSLVTGIPIAECWNRTDGQWATIDTGTPVEICHPYDTERTVISVRTANGLPVFHKNGKADGHGFRFIVGNVLLATVTGLPIPAKTRDIVGEILAAECGPVTIIDRQQEHNELRWQAAADVLNELAAICQELSPKDESVIRTAMQKFNTVRHAI